MTALLAEQETRSYKLKRAAAFRRWRQETGLAWTLPGEWHGYAAYDAGYLQACIATACRPQPMETSDPEEVPA